jgi:hypothetical protein
LSISTKNWTRLPSTLNMAIETKLQMPFFLCNKFWQKRGCKKLMKELKTMIKFQQHANKAMDIETNG